MSGLSVRAWSGALVASAALSVCVALGSAQVGASASASPKAKQSIGLTDALKASEVEVTGPESLILGNFDGIYKTTDAGRHWTTITPPLITSELVILSHIVSIVSVGNEHIWLECEGDSRFDFIPYSSNGGTTWSTGILPNGADNPTELQFPSSKVGWLTANIGSSHVQATYRTSDGGETWVKVTSLNPPKPPVVGQPPSSSNGSVPKGFALTRVFRVSRALSWAQASGPRGFYLLKSTDGGIVWNTITTM
jgi:photosystem II stability/assembly factor-like uncharacterized protein